MTQALRPINNASAERKTFGLFTAGVLTTTSYTRPLSLPHSVSYERVYISMTVHSFKTITKFLSNNASTHTILSYPSTSRTLRTATPISRSSGPLSREQVLTGQTRHAETYA